MIAYDIFRSQDNRFRFGSSERLKHVGHDLLLSKTSRTAHRSTDGCALGPDGGLGARVRRYQTSVIHPSQEYADMTKASHRPPITYLDFEIFQPWI